MAQLDVCVSKLVGVAGGATVVASTPAYFYGICASGSANATVIDVFNGASTAGTKVFMHSVEATAANHDGPYVPVICSNGITTTNIGTISSYVVFYALART
jgi:hypothetical protein